MSVDSLRERGRDSHQNEESDIADTVMSNGATVSAVPSCTSANAGGPSGGRRRFEIVQACESLLIVDYMPASRSIDRVAAFDMDGTLIDTLSGMHRPEDFTREWRFFVDKRIIRDRFQRLVLSGFKIVVMSNQGGIRTNPQQREDVIHKVTEFCRQIHVPMTFYFACANDRFRKPQVGMWEHLNMELCGDTRLKTSRCFYVGDAAGRTCSYDVPCSADPSSSDRKFAANIGVQFHTPEEYFLGYTPLPYQLSGYNSAWIEHHPNCGDSYLRAALERRLSLEIVLVVGPPCSGRSLYTRMLIGSGKTEFGGMTLCPWKTDDCSEESKPCNIIREVIASQRSAIIDADMWTRSERAELLAVASELKVPVRCFLLDIPIPIARHLAAFRTATSNRRMIPLSVFTNYEKVFEAVDEDEEGFASIVTIPFSPMFRAEQRKIASMLLT